MGMSNYLEQQGNKFLDVEVPKIVANSDHIEEAIVKSYELYKSQYSGCPNLSHCGFDDVIIDIYNKFWEKYND
tara:strand:- start:193 stop:411 length:219 start_codon:yes stop_codon:yes gene_type:complete